jgi:hypothetical protein
MALTKGSFSSGPDKHILRPSSGPAGGQGSAASSAAPADGANNQLAQNVYGTPPAGTRMPRMGSQAAEAAQFTPGWGDDNAEDSIMDGSTLGTASTMDGSIQGSFGDGSSPAMSNAADVPGTPGFPGLPDETTAQGKSVPAGAPGVSAVGAVSTHGVGESNQGTPQHTGNWGGPGQGSVGADTPAAGTYGAPPDIGSWGTSNAFDPQWSGDYPNPGSAGMPTTPNSDSPQWTGKY